MTYFTSKLLVNDKNKRRMGKGYFTITLNAPQGCRVSSEHTVCVVFLTAAAAVRLLTSRCWNPLQGKTVTLYTA